MLPMEKFSVGRIKNRNGKAKGTEMKSRKKNEKMKNVHI